MISGAHHVAISVVDMERSVAFYRDILGMDQLVPPFPITGEPYASVMGIEDLDARMCVMRKGSLMLELFAFRRPEPAPQRADHCVADHGISHFGIAVEGIDAYHDRLTRLGVAFHSAVQTFPSGMKASYGRDLDGNVFELLEMPQPAVQP